MWANMWLLVGEAEGDGAAGEHHQRERGLGGVGPVGAAGDEPDLVVERLNPSVVDAKADRGEDALAVGADRAGEGDGRPRRLRLALTHQRSSSSVVSLGVRSPAKTARRASLSP